MQVNWCYKGISESATFSDAEADAVLSPTGILSVWMLANGGIALNVANVEISERSKCECSGQPREYVWSCQYDNTIYFIVGRLRGICWSLFHSD